MRTFAQSSCRSDGGGRGRALAGATPSGRRLLVAALAALLAVANGCHLMGEPEPQRPRTVTEFMKQPRPGEGVLGP